MYWLFQKQRLKNNDCDLLSMPGYYILHNGKTRTKGRGDGVAISLRGDIQFTYVVSPFDGYFNLFL